MDLADTDPNMIHFCVTAKTYRKQGIRPFFLLFSKQAAVRSSVSQGAADA